MKNIELVKGQFTDEHELRSKQEKPYVAYSVESGRFMYNFIPSTEPADNEIWYKTTDMNYVQFDGVEGKLGGALYNGSMTYTNSNNGEYLVATFSEDIDELIAIVNGLIIPFEDHKKLTHILLPKGVLIGSDAFNLCTNLEVFKAEDFRFDSLGQSQFAGTKISEINIPNSIETIPTYCFDECSCLVNIYIPDTVTKISANCFRDCTSLTTINYNGKLSQWDAIEKEENWNLGCGEITLYCTDDDTIIPINIGN